MDYDFLFNEFTYIAKNMNISAAARELNTTQSALTKHLDNAEKELGVVLIERKKGAAKCSAITQAGQILLDAACSISHTYNSALLAIDQVIKTDAHLVMAGSTIKYAFREIVGKLNERLRGESPIVLRFNDRLEAMPFDLLRNRQLDIAFEPYSWMADTRLLASVPLFRIPAMLVVHESNALAENEEASIRALDGLGVLTRASQSDYSLRKHLHSLCDDRGIKPYFLLKGDESLSSMAFDHLDAGTVLFCPTSYEAYLKATVPFARFVRLKEDDSAFDMRMFYRDERDPPIEAIVRALSDIEMTV